MRTHLVQCLAIKPDLTFMQRCEGQQQRKSVTDSSSARDRICKCLHGRGNFTVCEWLGHERASATSQCGFAVFALALGSQHQQRQVLQRWSQRNCRNTS